MRASVPKDSLAIPNAGPRTSMLKSTPAVLPTMMESGLSTMDAVTAPPVGCDQSSTASPPGPVNGDSDS